MPGSTCVWVAGMVALHKTVGHNVATKPFLKPVGTPLEPPVELVLLLEPPLEPPRWNPFQRWNLPPKRGGFSRGSGNRPAHLQTHMEGCHAMLVDRATEQNVYKNVSMFRRSSQPIQIAVASRVLMSTRAKKKTFRCLGPKDLVHSPGGRTRFQTDDRCKQNVCVSRKKSRCLAGGPRSWYTSTGRGGGGVVHEQSRQVPWHFVLGIKPAPSTWPPRNGGIRECAHTMHRFMPTVRA